MAHRQNNQQLCCGPYLGVLNGDLVLMTAGLCRSSYSAFAFVFLPFATDLTVSIRTRAQQNERDDHRERNFVPKISSYVLSGNAKPRLLNESACETPIYHLRE